MNVYGGFMSKKLGKQPNIANKKTSPNASPKSNNNNAAERLVKIASSHKKTAEPGANQEKAREGSQSTGSGTPQSPDIFAFWTDAFKNMCDAAGGYQPKDAQDAAFSLSFQGVESLNDAADTSIKAFQESVGASKENIEALLASGNIFAEGMEVSCNELTRFANQLFADNADAYKEFLTCRTANDVLALQSNIMKNTLESCLEEFLRLNDMVSGCVDKAFKPLKEQTVALSEKLAYPFAQ